MEPLIRVENLTKHYHMGEVIVKALRGVSMELYPSELVVILGPSGSGKSTLLNILGGLDTPTDGHIYYKGKDISNANERQRTLYRRETIGFVFQFYNLIPDLSARENVLLASELSKNPLDIDDLLRKINILDRSRHFPSQLSGGQQQRVAIARALVKNPKLLLCDEPTGALDIETGTTILKTLYEFHRDYHKTVVIITHNQSIARIANRTIYIKDGLIDSVVINKEPALVEEVSW